MNWLVVLHPWPNAVPVVLWKSSLKNVPRWPHVEQRSYCAHYFAVVLHSGKVRQRLISCILFAPSPTSFTWTHPAQSHSPTVWPFCCGPSTLSPSVNKLSLCHVKHAAERRSVHTPTLCYRQTSAALFCCSTQSFPPVAAHSWCYYSFHSPAHLQAYVRSLLDFPASHIKDGGGGLRLVAINHKTKYMPMKVCETHGQRNLCLHPLPLPFRPPSPSPALP